MLQVVSIYRDVLVLSPYVLDYWSCRKQVGTVASVFKRGLGIRVVSLVKIMMFELIQHDTIVS
jgi:hypothetical protein